VLGAVCFTGSAAYEALRAIGGSAKSVKKLMERRGAWLQSLETEDPETRQTMLPKVVTELPEVERKSLLEALKKSLR